MCYVINEIMTPEEHGDFSVQLPFFEIPKNKINRLVIRTESSNYKPFFSNLNKNCSNLIALPASTNKNMIKSLMKLYKNAFPTIGLTKLDEANISAEELSILGELNCKIGILSGSRAIIGSIAFAKREVLAQYMKDMSI